MNSLRNILSVKRIAAVVLAVVLTFTMMPQMGSVAYADDDGDAVAQIVETGEQYASLGDAINVAKGKKTIQLLKDINLGDGERIYVNKPYVEGATSITLDLNGHTITGKYDSKNYSDGMICIWRYTILSIVDTSENRSGKIINNGTSPAVFTSPSDSNLTVDASVACPNGTAILSGYVLTLNGGEISGKTAIAQRVDYTEEKSVITINGGVIKGTEASIGKNTGPYGHDEGYNITINGGAFSDDAGNHEQITRADGKTLVKCADGLYWLLTCTITFDVNAPSDESTGQMDSLIVGKDTEYTLPMCRFIYEMHAFDGWIVDGTTYKKGDKITITNDTTVKANWKDDAINLFIQGVQVNTDNYKDVLGDGTVEVAMDLDAKLITIKLNNATIETKIRNDGGNSDTEFGIRYNVSDYNLNIELTGENKIVNNETGDGVALEQAMAIYQASKLTFTGDGSLAVEIPAEKDDIGYIGIDSRQQTDIDGASISFDLDGIGAARGYYQMYNGNTLSVVNGGKLSIKTGNSDKAYSVYAEKNEKLINVEKGSVVELVSGNLALNNVAGITDDTKELGVLVNTKPTADGYKLWDGEGKLGEAGYKYVRIPDNHVCEDHWGEASYTWTSDKSSVTAKHTCKVCGREETETVNTTSKVTTKPTCTEKGETLYTATFKNKAFKSQTKTVTNIDPLGHDWGEWKVTKAATETAKGVETRTCKHDSSHTESRSIPAKGKSDSNSNQKGSDGTDYGKGASAAAVNKAITSMKSDSDPKGTKFAPLMLKSTKQTKKSEKVTWKKVSGAKKYVLYGNKCGRKNKMKKIKTTTKNNFNVKKIAGKKLKKKTYYKYIVVALDKDDKVVSTSKVIHVATKGTKKKANPTKVKVTKPKKTKVKKHRKLCYESSNTSIATVSKKGVIKGKKKGTAKIYVYAQNGVSKTIKVTVK